MLVQELMTHIGRLPEHTPLADQLMRAERDRTGRQPWYSSQREHWQGWLSEYHTPGGYGRKPNYSHDAKTVWNRIQCLEMLVWMAEAVKLDRVVLDVALQAATRPGLHHSSRCGLFRATVTWSMIEARLAA